MTLLSTVIAVTVLAALTLAIVAGLRLEHPWLQPWALLRAALQLGVLTLILSTVIESPWLVAVFLAVMVLAATWTVMRRLALPGRSAWLIAGTITVATAVPLALVFGIGAIEASPRYLLAIGGIVVGNVMTICTLVGRTFRENLLAQHDEVEGWLALGATPRRAASRAMRTASSTALIPTTDQTRTTGLVVLPGAFVGSIFAGASPLLAAQFQLVVLASILAAGAVAIAVLTLALGAPRTLPEPPSGR